MTEQDLQLPMPDGIADAVLFSPEPSNPLPGVLHLPDIGSIRAAHREMAGRLASQGYTVLMPNPFYRTGRPPMWNFQRKMGEPRTMQRFGELVAASASPIDDVRGSASYRRHALAVMARRTLTWTWNEYTQSLRSAA